MMIPLAATSGDEGGRISSRGSPPVEASPPSLSPARSSKPTCLGLDGQELDGWFFWRGSWRLL